MVVGSYILLNLTLGEMYDGFASKFDLAKKYNDTALYDSKLFYGFFKNVFN